MKFKGFKPLIKTKRLELKPMPATFEMAHTLYELIDRNRTQTGICQRGNRTRPEL